MEHRVSTELGGKELVIETGKLAKQAHGSVTVRCGQTVILAAVVTAEEKPGQDFFPLTVDYREMAYAAGKIPGGFIKREGKPKDREVLTCRLIDRPLRPLFPDGFVKEVQISTLVLSADQENPADILAIIGASAALSISKIPFLGPVGAVRVGKINGQLVINPTFSVMPESVLDLVVAGTEHAVTMVEGGAKELSEAEMLEAIELAHSEIKKIVALQNKLKGLCNTPIMAFNKIEIDASFTKEVTAFIAKDLETSVLILEKQERETKVKEILKSALEKFAGAIEDEAEKKKTEANVKYILNELEKTLVRRNILDKKLRADGRALDEIRPISCDISILPRTHGSGLFTRGQTQALVVATIGTPADQQRIDDVEVESTKRFMLHYNFPSAWAK